MEGTYDVFVHDRQTGETERVSVASDGMPGDGSSIGSAISADGRYVVLGSDASNLVPGDDNHWTDIFVRDRQSGRTWRVSVASDGTEGDDNAGVAAISADGRYVAWYSFASTWSSETPTVALTSSSGTGSARTSQAPRGRGRHRSR